MYFYIHKPLIHLSLPPSLQIKKLSKYYSYNVKGQIVNEGSVGIYLAFSTYFSLAVTGRILLNKGIGSSQNILVLLYK